MGLQGRAQNRELLVGLEAAEALLCFQHAGRRPAQGHGGMAPAFDVGADPADRAHHVLDDVGAGQRAAQLLGQAQTRDREDLIEPVRGEFVFTRRPGVRKAHRSAFPR